MSAQHKETLEESDRESRKKPAKNILFTALFPYWQPHFIAECNFIEEHLLQGDRVTILECDASLRACDVNPGRKLHDCLICMGVRQAGIALLSSKIKRKNLVNKEAVTKQKWGFGLDFKTIEDLKKYKHEKLPVGKDIASSLISATLDTAFDPREHKNLVRKSIEDYLNVFNSAISHLKQCQYDLIYIFNGRFIPAKAWIRACEQRGVDYITHERLVRPETVLRIKNGSPHDVLRYAEYIKDFWKKNKDNPDVKREAAEFFEERVEGRSTGWYSFTANQRSETLPENWDSGRKNVAIFSSTESEFAALQQYFVDAPFTQQEDAYFQIVSRIGKDDKNIHFYLRIHPNSKAEKNRWWDHSRLKDLNNITIIPPESEVSSYQLLNKSDKIIIFMTTIGVEATYWGKPSILLSNSFYKGLDAAYEPKNLEEAVDLILDEHLVPKSRVNALAFGAYMRCGGYPLPYSRAVNYHLIGFKDKILGAKTEIHQWQQNNRTRRPVSGIKKLLRDACDAWHFRRIVRQLNGDLKEYRQF